MKEWGLGWRFKGKRAYGKNMKSRLLIQGIRIIAGLLLNSNTAVREAETGDPQGQLST